MTHWCSLNGPAAPEISGPVAWYVERVAPGMRDHGRRQGPYWSKDIAESYVDEWHVLRALYAMPDAQPKPAEDDLRRGLRWPHDSEGTPT